ncbi:MAG: hypothetical protein GTO55_09495 [Armatimonadetes bacterium]|nr:hypothetical protein [Armatimonadota bacterium]NIM24481.1 hypothetical protein [Armatimonadota bacterium]NIM68352.1 hypothetical protein [Armatimonadota bacterium]NIM76756.1 hypothetical protein [Armatimonadota bacterium]NIN06555.1 hypothetical protein [Armatimonadota bacterium]
MNRNSVLAVMGLVAMGLLVATIPGWASSLQVLSMEEMGKIVGGCNGQKCTDEHAGCGSLCLSATPEEQELGYISKKAIDINYTVCESGWWFQFCDDNKTVKCARWKYYTDDNCDPLCFEGWGTYITIQACDGST